MEPDQQRLNLEGLIKKLRTVTLAVQLFPFIYVSLYLVTMVFYLFASEKVMGILDSLFYVSPVIVAQFLALSRILRLCRWHKLACSLPLFPQVSVALDHTVILFSERAVEIHIITMMIMSSLLLISAYRVFFYGRK